MNAKILTILCITAILTAISFGQANDGNIVGKKAPEFTLKNYDGKAVNLSDYKGKIVVLEWCNYECPFSIYIHEGKPIMQDLVNKYKDKDVVWLAINSTKHQTIEKNKEFAQKNKIAYPILDDKDGKTGRAYGAQRTPHMFIVGKDGNVAYEGAIDDSPLGKKEKDVTNYVDKALSELIAGKNVSTPYIQAYGCSIKYVE